MDLNTDVANASSGDEWGELTVRHAVHAAPGGEHDDDQGDSLSQLPRTMQLILRPRRCGPSVSSNDRRMS